MDDGVAPLNNGAVVQEADVRSAINKHPSLRGFRGVAAPLRVYSVCEEAPTGTQYNGCGRIGHHLGGRRIKSPRVEALSTPRSG